MNTWYNEKSLMLVEMYIRHLSRPRAGIKKDRFAHYSYSIWAANELLEYMKNHSYNPPLESVNQFIKLMDEYSCMNWGTSYIFSIASDVAKDILDMLLMHV